MYDAMAADYAAAEDDVYNRYYEQPNVRALLPPVADRQVLTPDVEPAATPHG